MFVTIVLLASSLLRPRAARTIEPSDVELQPPVPHALMLRSDEIRFFESSYTLGNGSWSSSLDRSLERILSPVKSGTNGTNALFIQYRMLGYEPVATRGPVYIFASGGGVWPGGFNRSTPELEFARQMALRGFVSVMIEIPYLRRIECYGNKESLKNVTRGIFAYHGPSDTTSRGALATLCRRKSADCTAGIALHGHSLGGMLTNLAPQYVNRSAMALLLWSMGVFTPGGMSCCGLQSGNYSCCDTLAPQVGGELLRCMDYAQTSKWLPASRRRVVIASTDFLCACRAARTRWSDTLQLIDTLHLTPYI